MFLYIVLAVLTAIIVLTLASLRYLAEGSRLRRLRLFVLAFDVLAIGWFLMEAWVFHHVGGLEQGVVFCFMVQIVLAVLLALAAFVRFLWRRMMGVPVDARRRRVLARAALYPVAAAGVGLYGSLWERCATVDRAYTIPVRNLPAADAITVAQISDIHLGSFFSPADLDALLTRIAGHEKKPDLLAVTGDLFDDVDLNPEAVRVLDSHADDYPDGIWFALGNHEYFRGVERILAMLEETRVHVLRNAAERVALRGLWIAGADYPMDRPHFEEERRAYAEKTLGGIPAGAPTILLAHHPEFIDEAAEREVALTLTGHTHGSQFGIFGVPLFPVFRYTRGMVRLGDSCGYVHSGNGSWFPFRLGCPPEIAYFTLVPRA